MLSIILSRLKTVVKGRKIKMPGKPGIFLKLCVGNYFFAAAAGAAAAALGAAAPLGAAASSCFN